MNSLDSLRKMVDHYPGGRAAMAVRLGKTDEVLRKELSGTSPNHKLGQLDAEQIAEFCQEVGSPHCDLYALTIASRCGRLLELPVREMGNKQDLRADMAGLIKECSDAFSVLTSALADDRISDNERRAAERELGELAARLHDVYRGMRENHEASRPQMRAVG